MRENDSKEIPFHETKQQLLKDGFTESEIDQAVYASPYDGKKNPTKPEDPHKKAYKNNPEVAEQVGTQILEDAKERERAETIATGVASHFAPGRHAQSRYKFEFFERLGLPYFRIFFGGLLIFILVVVLKLPAWINGVFGAVIGLWIAYAFYTKYFKK